MPDEVNLLPCPLCAGEARQCEGRGSWDRLDTRSRPNVHWIECYSCCCRSGERPSAKEAINTWNTRAIEATRPTDRDAVQPIETAPKDGSYFLMLGGNFDGGMAVVHWDDWWMLDDGKNFEIALRNESKLTGWLPLPAAQGTSHD